MKNKNLSWAQRKSDFRPILESLPRKLREDLKLLLRPFFQRRSLRLRLTNSYLMKLWETSESTVKRRLNEFLERGILKKITYPPKRKEGGGYSQYRTLILKVPKSISSLAGQNETLPNKEIKSPIYKINEGRRNGSLEFPDYLALQKKVSKGAWAFWLNQQGGQQRWMGYLLTSIYPLIKDRPDLLESIIHDGQQQGLTGSKLVGWVVSEIKARTSVRSPTKATSVVPRMKFKVSSPIPMDDYIARDQENRSKEKGLSAAAKAFLAKQHPLTA